MRRAVWGFLAGKPDLAGWAAGRRHRLGGCGSRRPLADLGNNRLEMRWAFGREAMQTFTARYQARMPGLDFLAPRLGPGRGAAPGLQPGGLGGDPSANAPCARGCLFVDQALARLPTG